MNNINNIDNVKVLASGIDSLVVSLKVDWSGFNSEMFQYLDDLKAMAQTDNNDVSGCIKLEDEYPGWLFTMKPHGANGYEWLLISHDYALKISSKEITTRPNIIAEIRSETLWRLGVEEAIQYVKSLIEGINGRIIEAKISRLDMCIDITLPENIWTIDIIDDAITYAMKKAVHLYGYDLTGIAIGAGEIQARMYDKALEIRQVSKKYWMFDIWGLAEAPEDIKIIRVEFQLRREFLKNVHVSTPEDLMSKYMGIWLYCTGSWLKFQTNPRSHHTQRKNLDWWDIVHNGYSGCQAASPVIRDKAITMDKKRRIDQALGNVLSIKAIEMERKNQGIDNRVSMMEAVNDFMVDPMVQDSLRALEPTERIKRKRAKFHRVPDSQTDNPEQLND